MSSWVFKDKYLIVHIGWLTEDYLFFSCNLLTSFAFSLRTVVYSIPFRSFKLDFPNLEKKSIHSLLLSLFSTELNWKRADDLTASPWNETVPCVTLGTYKMKYSFALEAPQKLGTWIVLSTGKICKWAILLRTSPGVVGVWQGLDPWYARSVSKSQYKVNEYVFLCNGLASPCYDHINVTTRSYKRGWIVI